MRIVEVTQEQAYWLSPVLADKFGNDSFGCLSTQFRFLPGEIVLDVHEAAGRQKIDLRLDDLVSELA